MPILKCELVLLAEHYKGNVEHKLKRPKVFVNIFQMLVSSVLESILYNLNFLLPAN